MSNGTTPPTTELPVTLVPQTGMPVTYHCRSSELHYDTLEKNVRFILNPFGPQPLFLSRPNHHW
jgi:hypothetical protein